MSVLLSRAARAWTIDCSAVLQGIDPVNEEATLVFAVWVSGGNLIGKHGDASTEGSFVEKSVNELFIRERLQGIQLPGKWALLRLTGRDRTGEMSCSIVVMISY